MPGVVSCALASPSKLGSSLARRSARYQYVLPYHEPSLAFSSSLRSANGLLASGRMGLSTSNSLTLALRVTSSPMDASAPASRAHSSRVGGAHALAVHCCARRCRSSAMPCVSAVIRCDSTLTGWIALPPSGATAICSIDSPAWKRWHDATHVGGFFLGSGCTANAQAARGSKAASANIIGESESTIGVHALVAPPIG